MRCWLPQLGHPAGSAPALTGCRGFCWRPCTAARGTVFLMAAEPDERSFRPPERFPTRLDRVAAGIFCVLASATLAFAVLLAEPSDGFIDGIVPSLLVIAILWPQTYVFWRLYRHRRREQIAERQGYPTSGG